ncbi:hypothetical protein C8Q80DRAFT_592721 [Daedaleopsis nitida]|nr:hypothetical protein C8Q80DRAFT_592721 [Daedaleopsis nitida]
MPLSQVACTVINEPAYVSMEAIEHHTKASYVLVYIPPLSLLSLELEQSSRFPKTVAVKILLARCVVRSIDKALRVARTMRTECCITSPHNGARNTPPRPGLLLLLHRHITAVSNLSLPTFPLMPPAMLAILVLRLVASFVPVRTQEVNATCLETYDWMSNTLGQTPCLMSAFLGSPCKPSNSTSSIPPIESGEFYTGPKADDPELDCQCNTVQYSVQAACAWCQGHEDGLGIVDWPTWSAACTDPLLDAYPLSIPTETAIPAWAYADMGSDGRWNESAAYYIAGQRLPESAADLGPTSSASTDTGTSTPSETANTRSPTRASDNNNNNNFDHNFGSHFGGSHQKGRTTLIVVAVIGAILGALLLGIALWLCLRYRSRGRGVFTSRNHVDLGVHSSSSYESPVSPEKPGKAYNLYNPDDPRTFPLTPARFTTKDTEMAAAAALSPTGALPICPAVGYASRMEGGISSHAGSAIGHGSRFGYKGTAEIQ